ncbi:hypothetical protein BT93_L0602 [Corymbia citriodora subsp. variegata]|uniref:Amino acid transporter transmembrane domain-containing protein n=1 Tax=Corymbia citriodora subsp. variegata TaxID=360336 RepID=A0A8T0D0E8_CORYI|nr:hypothetical protein BT93_L0602 [Corymbia citriodora subsp. variegata]
MVSQPSSPPHFTVVDREEEEAAETGEGGRGTWKHAAFHVATTIATPAAYAPLPFALASLGWPLGVSSLVGATLATWYSSLLIASLWRWNGKKQVTYRHLARSIFGSWGYWSVAFFQQVASLGNNIAIQIAAGSSLKAIYKYYQKDGTLKLQHFIVFFGAFELVLSQLPNIHSLRWVNAICTFCTIGFAGTTIGVTIYNGKEIDRKTVSYSLQGSSSSKVFKAFNALGAIAFSFGDAMLPEIQHTVREPARTNMYKSVSAAYTIILISYWQLAFCGYWAFGSDVQPYILTSLTNPDWTIIMANIFAVIQIAGCFQADIRVLRGQDAPRQACRTFPVRRSPHPSVPDLRLHGRDYSRRRRNALLWRLCVHLRRNRLYPARLCAPRHRISEGRKNAREPETARFRSSCQLGHSDMVLGRRRFGLHWRGKIHHGRCQDVQVLPRFVGQKAKCIISIVHND